MLPKPHIKQTLYGPNWTNLLNYTLFSDRELWVETKFHRHDHSSPPNQIEHGMYRILHYNISPLLWGWTIFIPLNFSSLDSIRWKERSQYTLTQTPVFDKVYKPHMRKLISSFRTVWAARAVLHFFFLLMCQTNPK